MEAYATALRGTKHVFPKRKAVLLIKVNMTFLWLSHTT